jgi:pimeloyl-ACP methyl ester carboxylesterase
VAARIILVPGFWLGAWAWDEVADRLRAEGHDVTALTLPGLESAEVDRSTITLEDQVDAIVDAVTATDSPVVLAVHSGASVPGYAASNRVPGRIAAMVYVDTAPPNGPIDPEFAGVEKALPPTEQLRQEENLDGLTHEQLETFQRRGLPEPGSALREGPVLKNDARLDVTSTVICTSFTSEQYKEAAAQGVPWMAGLNDLHDITFIDLPTSHWPMWSRPQDLARILGDIATAKGG